MLPPALGGLRFHVPPVLSRHAPGSMEKIKLSCSHPQDGEIILHSPNPRQIAKLRYQGENAITARTKSHQTCCGKAGASETRPYQDDMVDLHPALSSPSATPLRSRGIHGQGQASRRGEVPQRRRHAQGHSRAQAALGRHGKGSRGGRVTRSLSPRGARGLTPLGVSASYP